MAGNPLATPLLVGLGIDQLSMNPSGLASVRYAVVSIGEVQTMPQKLYRVKDAQQIEVFLKKQREAIS